MYVCVGVLPTAFDVTLKGSAFDVAAVVIPKGSASYVAVAVIPKGSAFDVHFVPINVSEIAAEHDVIFACIGRSLDPKSLVIVRQVEYPWLVGVDPEV